MLANPVTVDCEVGPFIQIRSHTVSIRNVRNIFLTVAGDLVIEYIDEPVVEIPGVAAGVSPIEIALLNAELAEAVNGE
mgnify:CR=1 FL=1